MEGWIREMGEHRRIQIRKRGRDLKGKVGHGNKERWRESEI